MRYFERQQFQSSNAERQYNRHQIISGEFEEKIELDLQNMQYERLEVPEIEECKKATILHDFEKVITALIFW